MVLNTELVWRAGGDAIRNYRHEASSLLQHPLYRKFIGIYLKAEDIARKDWANYSHCSVDEVSNLKLTNIFFQEVTVGGKTDDTSRGVLVMSESANREGGTLFINPRLILSAKVTFPILNPRSPLLTIVTEKGAKGEKLKVRLHRRDYSKQHYPKGLEVYNGRTSYEGVEVGVKLAKVVDIGLTEKMLSLREEYDESRQKLNEGKLINLDNLTADKLDLKDILNGLKKYESAVTSIDDALKVLGLRAKKLAETANL